MGYCKICGARACYGFQQPGPRSKRTEHWIAWACREHRAEVETGWAAYFRGIDRGASGEGDKQEPARAVSAPAPEPDQGTLI